MIEVQQILRVQNENGIGPYQRDSSVSSMISDRVLEITVSHSFCVDQGIHPVPQYDKGIERDVRLAEKCGFKDASQLHQWFSKDEITQLSKLGYMVEEIEGVITAVGETQVLFVTEKEAIIAEQEKI